MILRLQHPRHLTTLREYLSRRSTGQRRSRASASWATDATCVPCAVEDAGERQAPPVGDTASPQLVQQPVVGAQRPVEPDRVVETGGEHLLPIRYRRMHAQRGAERELVGAIRERARLEHRVVAERFGNAHPAELVRLRDRLGAARCGARSAGRSARPAATRARRHLGARRSPRCRSTPRAGESSR